MHNIAYLFKDYLPQNYFLLPYAIYIYIYTKIKVSYHN